MFEDPIVEEIRRIRHAHAAQFNNDLTAIVADLQRIQRESGQTYVNFPPRRPNGEAAQPEQPPPAQEPGEGG